VRVLPSTATGVGLCVGCRHSLVTAGVFRVDTQLLVLRCRETGRASIRNLAYTQNLTRRLLRG